MDNLEAQNASQNVDSDIAKDGQVSEALGQETNLNAGTESSSASTQPTAQDVLDWTKDNRYKTGWINEKGEPDPNRLYKNYRDIEKVYAPLKKQYETLNNTFNELQIKPEQLKDIVGEYQQLKDSNHPIQQRASYLSNWLDNPVYSQQVVNFFNELEKHDMSRKFPGMSEEQIKKMVELETQVNELKQVKEKEEFNNLVSQESKNIETSISRAQKLAEARGFEWNNDIKNYLINHCEKNGIPTNAIFGEFIELFGKELDEAFSKKLEKDFLARQEKQKDSVVIPATGTTPPSDKFNFRESLLKAIKK